MKQHNGMRPQDIVILLKIICLENEDWLMKDLANSLYISPSEVSDALNRCKFSGLIDQNKRKVMKLSLYNFLCSGIKFVFPVKPGHISKGIPTSHSGSPLSEEIISGNDTYIWEDYEGEFRGQTVEPLYPNAIKAAKNDKNLYELLVLVDALRVGKAREVNLARDLLRKRFKLEQPKLQTAWKY